MMPAWQLAVWLEAAAATAPAPVSGPAAAVAKAAPRADDEEVIRNLDLLEDWDMLSRLGVLDEIEMVGDAEEGDKP
jgi:hypothetical protein